MKHNMVKQNPKKESLDYSLFYENTEALFEGEINLPAYNKSIVREFAKFFEFNLPNIKNNVSILDFGAGSGSLAQIFLELYSIKPSCVEIDPILVDQLRQRKFTVYENNSSLQNKFDFIYTSNVLEHIDDDLETLNHLRELMNPNGKIAIYVPAFPILFSKLDYQSGHFRRYTKKELVRKVNAAGFQVEHCFFNDSLGFPASLLIKIFGYRNNYGLGGRHSLIIYDRFIYPFSRIGDIFGLRFLFGKNLFLFAKL
jgi:SAM-dependent methyltransferase